MSVAGASLWTDDGGAGRTRGGNGRRRDLRRLIAVRPEERRSCGETEFVSELKPHTPDAFPRRSMWKTGSIPDVTERKTCLTGVCGNTDNSQPGAKVPFPMIYDDLTLPSRLRLIARG